MMSDKPEANPNVREITQAWLEEHGYDGLSNALGCDCRVSCWEFMLCIADDCEALSLPYCRAGYRVRNEEGLWTIVPAKPAE